MKFSISLVLLLLFNSSCAQISSKPITEVSRNEFNNVILVDVRTPEEYETGHIENALNINWYDEDFTAQFVNIPKEDVIYVYCKMGGRSSKAQQLLDSLGYKKVVNLEGGYEAYSKNQE